jgi:hypothetical protein
MPVCDVFEIHLLQKSDNPAFFCMIFAFFEEIRWTSWARSVFWFG